MAARTDLGGRSDRRQRRAWQMLGSDPFGTLGLVAGAGIVLDDDSGSIGIDLRDTTPALELHSTGLGVIVGSGLVLSASGVEVDLRDIAPCLELAVSGIGVTLEKSTGIFVLGSTGLDSRFITTAGVATDIDLTMTCDSNADNFVSLVHPLGGEVTLSGTQLTLAGQDALICQVAGSTCWTIDATTFLMESVDQSVSMIFRVPDITNFGAVGDLDIHTGDGTTAFGLFASGTLTLRGGDQNGGFRFTGGPVVIRGGESRNTAGGPVTISGGTAAAGANPAGGTVRLIGGKPLGTGASQCYIQVTDNASSISTRVACDLTGLGFFGLATAAQQTAVAATSTGVRAALAAYNLITEGADAKTSPEWQKHAVSQADFTGGGGTEQSTLFSLGAGQIVHAVKIKPSTSWAGGGAATATLSVGIAGVPAKYHTAFDVFQPVGNTVQSVEANIGTEDHISVTSIVAELVVTGGSTGGLTAGAADIWVLISQANGDTPDG